MYMKPRENFDSSMDRVDMSYDVVKNLYKFDFNLKQEQLKLITAAIDKKDSVGFLPTGFGKSLCYTLTPLLLDQIEPEKKHICLVVSSLISLMNDQKSILDGHGISAAIITAKKSMDDITIKMIENGDCSIVFTSPELAISKRWMKVFRGDTWQRKICLVAVDECHCISEWGESFRPEYRQISTLRSVFDTPCMALTATVTKQVKEDVLKYLTINTDYVCIAVLPDRPNIYLEIKKTSHHYEIELSWIVQHLKDELVEAKKMIIYCRSIPAVSDIYLHISDTIGESRFLKREEDAFSIIEMYHASSSDACKNKILEEFKKTDSKIRCLVATVAFGMGVNIPDIDVVVHWGAPKNMLSYWQEIGRAARDARQGVAVMYPFGYSLNPKRTEESVKKMCQDQTCVRKNVMNYFKLDNMTIEEGNKCEGRCDEVCACDLCKCCSVCFAMCTCSKKKKLLFWE